MNPLFGPVARHLLSIALFACAATVRAEVRFAPLFTADAVLQRDKPLQIWGTATPGEAVRVEFADQASATVADHSGHWRVELPALPASNTPRDLVARGTNTVIAPNLVVGDVWLASGQSNMQMTVASTHDAALDMLASARFPLIRQFRVKQVVADNPASVTEGAWAPAGPNTLPQFSAAAYYFALDVHQVLGVPIGIINSSWSGSRIEAWIQPEALAQPEFSFVNAEWTKTLAVYPKKKAEYETALAAWETEKAAAQAAGRPFTQRAPFPPQGPGHHFTPAGLYNGMIAPLLPYAIKGFLWYQGEANAGQPERYRSLFPSLIQSWRARFAQGDLPFYWVQLPNYKTGGNWQLALIRESQEHALTLPNTGQVVTIDIGETTDIHPRDKRPVGRRLARLALARTYGLPIVDTGPRFARVATEGSQLRVHFTDTKGGIRCLLGDLGGFEIAGDDRVFKPAKAVIEGDTVLVSNEAIPQPIAVRYAWSNAPIVRLYNVDGLPVAPFRSDTW
jgi:sialate O-acetylesterase